MAIAIIDYGMGNLRSVQKAFAHVGYQAEVTRDPQQISTAEGLVLPGVGAFRDCMYNLKKYDLIAPLKAALEAQTPFLGICLGFQLLFTESEEFGVHAGLNILPGRVVRFPDYAADGKERLKIPHMGWNQVEVIRASPLFQGIASGTYFYFVHSYYVVPDDPGLITTTTTYGVTFASSIHYRHIYATQFHPEKSQKPGLQLLQNFGKLVYHAPHSGH
ncbi:MAG: imidazole glycerol phosphate synthase subunit HisH [Nitrospinota bacterium]|nr:MAG: imidazole glycerol phosphate synthase subunit HisH [Nitrospinota bacterium]